jgi:hypothetical protein
MDTVSSGYACSTPEGIEAAISRHLIFRLISHTSMAHWQAYPDPLADVDPNGPAPPTNRGNVAGLSHAVIYSVINRPNYRYLPHDFGDPASPRQQHCQVPASLSGLCHR